jgi:site-specific DNA-methyltransferase (adenine-specific)
MVQFYRHSLGQPRRHGAAIWRRTRKLDVLPDGRKAANQSRDELARFAWSLRHAARPGRTHRRQAPELMRAVIRDYSNEGDLVCDPCAGYGTTLIAAAQMQRRAIGSEIDADAYAEACARIDAASRQGSLL